MASKRKTTDGQPAEPTYLCVREERSGGYCGQYFHLRARVVRQRYEQGEGWVPYGLDDQYGQGLLYSGLQVTCQGDERSQLRPGDPVYGFEVEYHDVHTIRLAECRRMAKTLEHIERQLQKLEEKRGYCRNFPEYLGRVAEAIGCKGIAIDSGERSQRTERRGYRWEFCTTGDGINRVSSLIYAWTREADERQQREALPAASMREPLPAAAEESEAL